MKKLYILLLVVFLTTTVNAQEVLTFSGYDGAGSTATATTATINDPITVIFEDVDIVNNFYTENQTFIHMYLGLTTANGSFQAVPAGFNDLSWQPVLNLTDGDGSAPPNTYSITFTPGELFPSLDGENILGINLLFQNQFGGGGNNQTVDLFIDLVDAILDFNTLSTTEFETKTVDVLYTEGSLKINGLNENMDITIFDLSGKKITEFKNIEASGSTDLTIDLPKNNVYILNITSLNYKKALKIISK